jgi:(2Fe-2S) ferredoxin
MNDKWIKRALMAFLCLGACSYGCMFATYVLWFLGVID